MIPLRDANPTRRTPIVTLALILACFVVAVNLIVDVIYVLIDPRIRFSKVAS